MKLITNSVDASSVREVTEDGTRYLVADDIRFIRPQVLNGGYVPERHVRQSVGDWNGQPLTANHPTNDADQLVSANTQYGEQATVGEARSPTENADGSVSADLWVDADRAESQGEAGAAIVTAMEGGDGLDVSSQYFADDLPPGVYDGEYYEQAEGNLSPDSIALLPSSEGVCSLPDCGIAPGGGAATATANSTDKHLSVTAEPDPSPTDAAPDPDPGLVRRGLAYLGSSLSPSGGVLGSDTTTDSPPTANNGDSERERGQTRDHERDDSRPGESGRDASGPPDDMKREELIDEITANSEIEASSLEGMGDTCLQTTHDSIVGNSEGGGEDDPENETETEAEADDETPEDENETEHETESDMDTTDTVEVPADAIPDAVASGEKTFGEVVDERITANEQQNDKERMVEGIVANSAEYDADDRDDLLDTPFSMLEKLRDGIDAGSPGLPGRSSATANAATPGADVDDVDMDDFGTGVIGDD